MRGPSEGWLQISIVGRLHRGGKEGGEEIVPLLSLRSVEGLNREGCFCATCFKSPGKLCNRILKIVAREQLTGGFMGDPAGRLKDKADLLRHHLPKTISTSRREARAGETRAQLGENTGTYPELKSLFRQDIFGPKNREKTTEVSPALLDSGLERQLLKFVIAEHNAKVGVLLAKRQVDGTTFTLETEAGAFLLVMLQKRFQQT